VKQPWDDLEKTLVVQQDEVAKAISAKGNPTYTINIPGSRFATI